MNMKRMQRVHAVRLFVIFLGLLFIASSLWADESLVKIADDGNTDYFKPEVKIHPDGSIYVVYQAHNLGSGRSEIHMSKYGTNGKVSFVKNISESSAYSYEPEIDIRNNGDIYVAWADQSGDTHVIKYRSFNGGSWSGIQTMGQVTDRDNVEDLRIAVDPSGNVFIVFMHWRNLDARCNFISKHGNNVRFEDWPQSGRSKHPDVEADGNYVHIVWQYRAQGGGQYTIAYQRRPNSPGSGWENWIDFNFYPSQGASQRPRMSLDGSNTPHVVWFHNLDPTRRLMYKRWTGNGFGDLRIMSDPNNFVTYHFCDVSAADPENVIATMQKGGHSGGRNVSYNWKQNGNWSGFNLFGESTGYRPTKQSIDLAPDRFFVAVAFADRDDGVYLIIVEEAGGPGGNAPAARFTFSPQGGHAPLDVTFDGTASTDEDGQVTAYRWNFGDGSTGTGATTTHRFATQGTYTVTLTVTDNDGKTGSTTHSIVVDKPNEPPLAAFTFSPINGLYPLTVTFDGGASTDSDGFIEQYEWDFGGEQSAEGQVVSFTFSEEGLHTVVLEVYDDDGASSSASATVEVLGLLPPLSLAAESLINRNLFTIQYVYRLTWNRNAGNARRGANIIQYNIYRKRPSESAYSFVITVNAQDSNEYYDRIGTTQEEFQYAVTAVDDQGRESKLPSTRPHGNTPIEKKLIH
jgi:PKD repeat protein